jgi:MFS transporter, SHS family, lactate transporter
MSEPGSWGRAQRSVVTASYLGWTLDAFDYFLVVFVLRRLSADFGTSLVNVTWAITATLAMRPIGAFIFGRLADRFGRRPALMSSVLMYSLMEVASAFAPSLRVFILLRALYGVAMGGEWGVGASLAFESIPVRSRGWVSGLLQAGYASGYLLAAIAFGLLFEHIGWRGLFIVGAIPAALLVVYIAVSIPESPDWQARRQVAPAASFLTGLRGYWGLALYAVVLMTFFNLFAHGTQDLYPTFLGGQRGFSTRTISLIVILYNIGAICGGILFGRLSSRIGRRYAAAIAALLALPALPFWAFGHTVLAVAAGAFVVQVMVQGAWGVIPIHLNELSPPSIRATFPGVVYQLGNLIASSNATVQATIAVHVGSAAHPNYAFALALVSGIVIVVLTVLVLLGPERRDVRFEVEHELTAAADRSTPAPQS